jgi:RND family efflux transporter MFP subunit
MADEDLSRLKVEKRTTTGGRRRMGRPVLWGLAAVIALAAALALSGVLSPKVEVKTAVASMVYPAQTFTRLNASGYVVAERKAAVAAKATGRLDWLGVGEGSHIKKGQIIARLESEDVRAAESQAKANLASARAAQDQAANNIVSARANLDQAQAELTDSKLNIDRQKDLFARGIVAKADYDAAEARYKKAVASVEGAKAVIRSYESALGVAKAGVGAASAALKGAEVNVDYTVIRAPFDAVVLTKNADIGDIVTPIGASVEAKAAVVTIADLGSLEVEADVSESNLGQVKAGEPCEVQLDALPDKRFKGEVSTIVPTADRSKASVMVKVRFIEGDPRILPEMSAKVAFLEREPTAAERSPLLAVNPAAVVTRRGGKAVFVIKGDKADLTPVTLGKKLGDWVEVTGGLKAGDKVAISPLNKLNDGTKVKEAVE